MEVDNTGAFRRLKRTFLAYNVVFWLSGPGVFAVGVWFYISLAEYSPLVEREDFAIPAYVIIVSGIACFLAGILGWTATVGEKPSLLNTYFCCILVIVTAEMASAVLVFLLYDKASEKIQSRIYPSLIVKYNKEAETTRTIDKIQSELRCCGIRNYGDWAGSGLHRPRGSRPDVLVLPQSCCSDVTSECVLQNTSPAHNSVHNTGCLFSLSYWIQTKLIIAGWISAGCACWQIIGLSFVCCFQKAVTDGFA